MSADKERNNESNSLIIAVVVAVAGGFDE